MRQTRVARVSTTSAAPAELIVRSLYVPCVVLVDDALAAASHAPSRESFMRTQQQNRDQAGHMP